MSLQNKIKNLQKKPYNTRIKILWTGVILTGIIIILIWLITIKFRSNENEQVNTGESNAGLDSIIENLKNAPSLEEFNDTQN